MMLDTKQKIKSLQPQTLYSAQAVLVRPFNNLTMEWLNIVYLAYNTLWPSDGSLV